jgi:hypothetical protein
MFKAEIFRQCRSTALRKIAVSPFAKSPLATRCRFAIRYSPFTIRCLFTSRYSPFAAVFFRPADLPTSRFA